MALKGTWHGAGVHLKRLRVRAPPLALVLHHDPWDQGQDQGCYKKPSNRVSNIAFFKCCRSWRIFCDCMRMPSCVVQ